MEAPRGRGSGRKKGMKGTEAMRTEDKCDPLSIDLIKE